MDIKTRLAVVDVVLLPDGSTVEVDTFNALFEDCEWDYESLIARDTAGDLGYREFFDELKRGNKL